MGYHMGIVQLDGRLGIPIWGGPGLPKMRHPRQNKSTKGLAMWYNTWYNRGMKTIDYTAIDTFTLSQEDVTNRPLRDRLSYALHQTALAMQLKYSCSYGSGMSIAKDSLSAMKVAWI